MEDFKKLRKYFSELSDSKPDDIDKKQRDFLEQRQALKSAPVKSDRYTSDLAQDVGQITSGEDFKKKIASRTKQIDPSDTLDYSKLRKQFSNIAKKAGRGVKALPLVGPALGAALAIGSDDASAALPILGDSEAAGMSSSAEDQFIAEQLAKRNYEESQASKDRKKLLESMKMAQGE